MDSATEARVREIVAEAEKGWRASSRTTFPRNCCGWTSSQLVVLLREALPNVAWTRMAGFFDTYGHCWVEAGDEAGDSTIVDPTCGQFIGGDALRIIRPGDDLHKRFHYDEDEAFAVSSSSQVTA